MANTGVTVADAVIDEFNDVKLGRKEAKFITYKIEDGLIVTETIGTSTDFEEFVNLLPENDCRYAVYDCEFVTTDGRDGKKLVLISWAPDSSKVKSKMVYAGSKDALGKALVGISVKVNATDRSELTLGIIQDACKKFA